MDLNTSKDLLEDALLDAIQFCRLQEDSIIERDYYRLKLSQYIELLKVLNG